MSIFVQPRPLDLSNQLLYLHAATSRLNLPFYTHATASYLMHRFATQHDIAEPNIVPILTSCILLACKMEETLKKVKDIYAAVSAVYPSPAPFSDAQKRLVLDLEQRFMESIGYNFHFIQPQKYVIKFARKFNMNKEQTLVAWNIAENRSISFISVFEKLIRVSFRTDVCVQYTAHAIALSAIYLSAYFTPGNGKVFNLYKNNLANTPIQAYEIDGIPPILAMNDSFKEISRKILAFYEKNDTNLSYDTLEHAKYTLKRWFSSSGAGSGAGTFILFGYSKLIR